MKMLRWIEMSSLPVASILVSSKKIGALEGADVDSGSMNVCLEHSAHVLVMGLKCP